MKKQKITKIIETTDLKTGKTKDYIKRQIELKNIFLIKEEEM